LLDIALDLIEHANGDVLPVLDGAALRNALTERQGLPIKIYERASLQVDETNNLSTIN
jgi:L,D-transpeptidase ErfK/SrfK